MAATGAITAILGEGASAGATVMPGAAVPLTMGLVLLYNRSSGGEFSDGGPVDLIIPWAGRVLRRHHPGGGDDEGRSRAVGRAVTPAEALRYE